MNFPSDLRYTKDHEWLRIESDGQTGYVGVTDFAQNELGDIVYIEIKALNQQVETGGVFGTVEAVKTVSDLYLPAAGEVLELNADLESKPELVNTDPYNAGWIVKVRLRAPLDESQLLDAAAYRASLNL